MTTEEVDAHAKRQRATSIPSPLNTKQFYIVAFAFILYVVVTLAVQLAGPGVNEMWLHLAAIGTLVAALLAVLARDVVAIQARQRQEDMDTLARQRREDNDAMARAFQRVTRNEVALGQKLDHHDLHLTTALAGLHSSRLPINDETDRLATHVPPRINGNGVAFDGAELRGYLLGVKDREDDDG